MLGLLLGRSGCAIRSEETCDDVEEALSGRKESGRMGVPSSVGSQQDARLTANTGPLYCPSYISVPQIDT